MAEQTYMLGRKQWRKFAGRLPLDCGLVYSTYSRTAVQRTTARQDQQQPAAVASFVAEEGTGGGRQFQADMFFVPTLTSAVCLFRLLRRACFVQHSCRCAFVVCQTLGLPTAVCMYALFCGKE